jgi:hypothetical protein
MIINGIDMKNKSVPINEVGDPLENVSDKDLLNVVSHQPRSCTRLG